MGQRMLNLRCVAGDEVEVVDRNGPFPVGSGRVYDGVEGHERNCDVGGMRRDAALTDAEHGVAAIQALER